MNVYTYRGYIYDIDTGFYYLQSRYYDPEVGRFLNADDISYLGASGTTLGYNLYAYCENNTVNSVDPTGEFVTGRGIAFQLLVPTGGFVSISYIWDDHGNKGILISTGVGMGIFTISLSFSVIISWRKTIYDYAGYGFTVGGSYTIGPSIGLSVGGDLTFDKKGLSGFTLSVGLGVSLFRFEGHALGTITILIPIKKHNYSIGYLLSFMKAITHMALRRKS